VATRRRPLSRGALRPRPADDTADGFDGRDRRRRDGRGRQASSGIALPVALLAVVLGGAGLAFGVARAASGPASCESLAWASVPDPASLPDGWSIAASALAVDSLTMTINGPTDSASGSQASVFATVTCYGSDGSEAIARSRAADQQSGGDIAVLDDVGDEGYSVTDTSGTAAVHFRRGPIVADVAASGAMDPAQLADIAGAVDDGIRGAKPGSIPTVAPKSPQSSGSGSADANAGASAEASDGASASAAAGLEGVLPDKVGDVQLTKNSTVGDLGSSPTSRAFTASLRNLGQDAAKIEVAQAFDEANQSDVSVLAFRLPGGDTAKVRQAVIESWLGSGAKGVKTASATLGDKKVTRVTYGDNLSDVYVYTHGNVVFVVETSDPALATDSANALP